MNNRPVCLTIAGLDPSGGAGIIADIKTFTAFGCFATAAVTSLTFQNTTGVFGAVHQTAASIRGQVEPVFSDFTVNAVKTGMLPTREAIVETAQLLERSRITNLVIDPVVRSTSGFDLIDDAALQSLTEFLFPLALIVTPNLPEAERIVGFALDTESRIASAADKMLSMGAKNVLIKGGHIADRDERGKRAVDHLFGYNGHQSFDAEFIETNSTHGTGCILAAAITANLALGNGLTEAVGVGKDFVLEAIRSAEILGNGHSPVNIPIIWPAEQK